MSLKCKQTKSTGEGLLFFLPLIKEDFIFSFFFLICKTLGEFYLVFTSDNAFHHENEELQILTLIPLNSNIILRQDKT